MSFAIDDEGVKELTLRGVLLAILLTVVLAMSNAYLALKIGMLTSASIPAAIISMAILRFFKESSIRENNAVQTAASAGEAVAGGIVYTVPALIIIQYWEQFDYFTNFFIALFGGCLGVLFSIPLRRILVHDASLRFPEGKAIAEVLKSTHHNTGIRYILSGGILGGLLELLQLAFKVFANSVEYWIFAKRALFGFGVGFSATLLGAGYLIGYDMAASIFVGAILMKGLVTPLVSLYNPSLPADAFEASAFLWTHTLRYVGIGAMLFAGLWMFFRLIKPLAHNIRRSTANYLTQNQEKVSVTRTEKDLPAPIVLMSILSIACLLFLFFQYTFPVEALGLDGRIVPTFVFLSVLYILVFGTIFSVITAYFSGMVGVTATPGSSIMIAGILFAAWLLLMIMKLFFILPFTADQLKAAKAITIIIGSVIMGIAAIANDNTQDLKVGQLVGATPWRQQVMLLLGVLVASAVIPFVMQTLFNVYGIAGVMPRPHMDTALSLPAPTAAIMAAITEAMFSQSLPWPMLLWGTVVILLLVFLNKALHLSRYFQLSILGVAIGMYLSMTASFPLFIGGLISLIVERKLHKKKWQQTKKIIHQQRATLIACGLVAGSALVDVLLAIPFSYFRNPDALALVGPAFENYALVLSILATTGLGFWIVRTVCNNH